MARAWNLDEFLTRRRERRAKREINEIAQRATCLRLIEWDTRRIPKRIREAVLFKRLLFRARNGIPDASAHVLEVAREILCKRPRMYAREGNERAS
jgi:hypothetical protein